MKRKTYLFLTLCTIAFLCSACKEDDTAVEPVPDPKTQGVVVINEGGFGQNNASITYYVPDSNKTYANVYAAANNNNKLGDNANSIFVYGDLAFIAVDNSNKIEIINKNTFVSAGSIDLKAMGSPREIYIKAASEGYVSSMYTGTVIKFDPSAKTETKRIPVGDNPDGIVERNGMLYVAISGTWPTYGNTVKVISTAKDSVVKTLTVGRNPRIMLKDTEQNVYVVCTGQYAPEDVQGRGGIYKINTVTQTVVDSIIIFGNPGEACFAGTDIYIVNDKGLQRASFANRSVTTTPVIDGSKVNTVSKIIYSVAFDAQKQVFFLGNPKNFIQEGEIAVFSLTGSELYRFPAGLNPGSIYLKK